MFICQYFLLYIKKKLKKIFASFNKVVVNHDQGIHSILYELEANYFPVKLFSNLNS